MLIKLKISPLSKELMEAGQSILDLLEAIASDTSGDTAAVLSLADWPHPSKPPTKAMRAALALTPTERGALLDTVRHDLSFESNINDEEFRFEFPALPAGVRKAGKALLGSIYESVFFKKGMQVANSSLVNRKKWEEDFKTANDGLELCPACLLAIWEQRVDDRATMDLDHFLPKALYPQLSVHGLNFVPLCKLCNLTYKGQKDPLSPSGGRLTSIWFPYYAAGLEEAEPAFSISKTGQPGVKLTGPACEEQIANFETLFRVSQRWSDRLNTVHACVQHMLNARFKVALPTLVETKEELSRFVDEKKPMAKRSPEDYLSWKYSEWLMTDTGRLTDLIGSLR
jgi:hypothetical protein